MLGLGAGDSGLVSYAQITITGGPARPGPPSGGLQMSLTNLLIRLARGPAAHRRPNVRLNLEPLEGRLCPSGGYLFVDSYNTRNVLRYDEASGAFVDEFVKKNSGDLYSSVEVRSGCCSYPQTGSRRLRAVREGAWTKRFS